MRRGGVPLTLTCGVFFAGAGGKSLGFEQAGFDVRYAVDNWDLALDTHYRNFPSCVPILADIGKRPVSTYQKVDVVIGSPPCTQLSIANKNRDPAKGMKLVRRFLEIVAYLKPKYWVMENVPQVLDFLFLQGCRRTVLNAADYGTPQIRHRAFIGKFPLPTPTHARAATGTLDAFTGGSTAELPSWITVRQALGLAGGHLPFAHRRDWNNNPKIPRSNDEPAVSVETSGILLTDQYGPESVAHSPTYSPDRPARSLTHNPHQVAYLTLEQIKKMRYYRGAKEYEREMDFPDRVDRPSRAVTGMAGSIRREGLIIDERDLSPRTYGTDERRKIEDVDRPAPTISFGGGHDVEGGGRPIAIPVGPGMTQRMAERAAMGGRTDPVVLDPDYPSKTVIANGGSANLKPLVLRVDEIVAVAPDTNASAPGYRRPVEVAPTIIASSHAQGGLLGVDRAGAYRRLTVEECAILQGFPPSFTFLGSKTARYKQVGNAVSPPVAFAIARAILEDAT